MIKREIKFYHGIAVFIFQIIIMLFVCTPLQHEWGMAGLAATEIILLIIAAGPVLLMGNSFKDVFPFKSVSLRQVASIAVFWAAGFGINALSTAVILFFIPNYADQNLETNRMMTEVFASIPIAAAFFIVAVMPAVCEEALHRGFIQYSMRGIKNKWLLIFVIGIIFGIFHLDPVRFVGTALLGMVLAYVMTETENILIPMLFHFFNNAVTFLISISSKELTQAASAEADAIYGFESLLIGAFMMIGAFAPILFYFAALLLHTRQHNEENKDKRRKTLIIAISAGVLLFITGLTFMFIAMLSQLKENPVIIN